MLAPIILYGSPVLRKYSTDITEEDNIEEITAMLFDTLKNAEGIGLAAPQINLLRRVFVIDTTPLVKSDVTIERCERIFINPVIIDRSIEKSTYKEGCLSFPGLFEDIDRPEKILVRYQDTSLTTIEEELDDIRARIFQHEYDHLAGILFIDKINILKKKLLAGKLNKIKKLSRS
jgi:peptide deformylase